MDDSLVGDDDFFFYLFVFYFFVVASSFVCVYPSRLYVLRFCISLLYSPPYRRIVFVTPFLFSIFTPIQPLFAPAFHCCFISGSSLFGTFARRSQISFHFFRYTSSATRFEERSSIRQSVRSPHFRRVLFRVATRARVPICTYLTASRAFTGHAGRRSARRTSSRTSHDVY